MLCPNCRVELNLTERQHIEIDYCPQCRGVWLDRGELDKMIERSQRDMEPAPAARVEAPRRSDYQDDRRYNSHHDQRPYKSYKRKSFLSELLDF